MGIVSGPATQLIILDATVVAPLLEKSYAMFGSMLGTRFPLFLVLVARYFIGIGATDAANLALPNVKSE